LPLLFPENICGEAVILEGAHVRQKLSAGASLSGLDFVDAVHSDLEHLGCVTSPQSAFLSPALKGLASAIVINRVLVHVASFGELPSIRQDRFGFIHTN
jgi:hypothetical protein